MRDPTERFSDRVVDYARYRPSYPPGLLDLMRGELGLRPGHTVADVGSGTGILSTLLLENGNTVFGVEPNRAMREAAERALGTRAHFFSIEGTAEQTGLADASVDFVTVGQAFHWFAPTKTHAELCRILRPPGWIVLVWNVRRLGTTPFLKSYEAFLIEWGTDYRTVRRSYEVDSALAELFGAEGWKVQSFPNEQTLDAVGFRGRVLSSSYMPGSDHPDRSAMLDALGVLFEAYQEGGRVRLEYDTTVYFGRLRDGEP